MTKLDLERKLLRLCDQASIASTKALDRYTSTRNSRDLAIYDIETGKWSAYHKVLRLLEKLDV